MVYLVYRARPVSLAAPEVGGAPNFWCCKRNGSSSIDYGLPHCIVCRDSLLALGDNKMLIYASFHGKKPPLVSEVRVDIHALCALQLMKAFVVEMFCTLYVCTAVLQCSTFVLNHCMTHHLSTYTSTTPDPLHLAELACILSTCDSQKRSYM